MKLKVVGGLPTVVRAIPAGSCAVHESTLRAYNILELVKGWLSSGVPAGVILDLIADLEDPDV